MAKKYLNPDGLSYFWSQIKAMLSDITTTLGNHSSTLGTHTTEISQLQTTVGQHTTKLGNQRTVKIDCGSFSSLPKTVSNSKIKSSDIVIEAVMSNPEAQIGDWTISTSEGSLTISGSISGTTSLTLYLTVPE